MYTAKINGNKGNKWGQTTISIHAWQLNLHSSDAPVNEDDDGPVEAGVAALYG